MKVNKEKVKKIGKIVFNVLGVISIAIILWVLITIPHREGPSLTKELPLPYDYEGYTGEISDLENLSSAPSSFGDSAKESSVGETYRDDSSDYDGSESTKEIKTGTLSIVLDDLDVAMDEFENIKDEYSGSVTYSYESGEGLDKYISMTLKIASDDFEKAFEEISEIEGEVEYSYTNTVDVTEQYVDLQSRLKNLEAVEVQLTKIMETAETVEDTLAVYSELSSTRSQIEVLKGQIRYLDNQTDYSYITVTFSLSSVGADITEDNWKPLGVLKSAFRSFISILKGLVDIFIWVLVFSPLGIIIYGIYWLINRKIKKSKK